jgi:hypothetical protein
VLIDIIVYFHLNFEDGCTATVGGSLLEAFFSPKEHGNDMFFLQFLETNQCFIRNKIGTFTILAPKQLRICFKGTV